MFAENAAKIEMCMYLGWYVAFAPQAIIAHTTSTLIIRTSSTDLSDWVL